MPPLPLRRRSAQSPSPLPPAADRFVTITSSTGAINSPTGPLASSSVSPRRATVHESSAPAPDACNLDVITSSPGAITSMPGYVITPSAGACSPKRACGFVSDNASSRRAPGAASRATSPFSTQHRVLESYGVRNLAEIMANPTATARALAHVRQVASCTGDV
jgi:hypothetical protein